MTRNPFTQPLRETMNDPQFDWARPQTRRRQLVMAFFGLLIVTPVLAWAIDSVIVIAVMLLPFVMIMGSLNASVRGLSELRSRDLDERENRVREPVYTNLYWPGVFVAVGAGLLMGQLDTGNGLLVSSFGLSLFNLAMALPTLWLAWTMPNEPVQE